MLRMLLAACLVLTVSASVGACKDDKELDDIPAPSAEQIAAAKKKAAERKKDKDGKKADAKKKDAKKKDAKAAAKDGTAKKDAKKAAGKPAGSAKDTAAERREKRKQRLAELKKRSEERRKERLERLKKRRDDNAKKRADAALKSDKARSAMTKAAAGAKKADAKPGARTPAATAKKTPTPVKENGPRATTSKSTPSPAAAATPAPATPVNALKIERYVSLADVKEITAKPELRAAGALVGIAPSARYNSVMFVGDKDAFGAAVQVWKEVTQRAADRRFRNMKRDYPNRQDTNAVSTKGFFSSFGDLMTLVFFEPFKRTVIAVTCSTKVCTQESLLALAKRVKSQM